MNQKHPWRRWGVCGILSLATTALLAAADPPPDSKPAETKPADPAPVSAPAPAPATPAPSKPDDPAKKPAEKEPEPEVVLHLNDGRRFSGFLVEKNAKEYILRIAGIKTPFKADQVSRYQILPPVLDRYRELRKVIDDQDVDQIIRLVEWLTERDHHDVALKEMDALLKRVPESTAAQRARNHLLARIELRDKAITRPTEGDPAAPPADLPALPNPPNRFDDPEHRGAFEPFPYLAPGDISLVKVFEIDLTKPPRLEVPRDVIDTLLEKHAGHPAIPTSREGRDGVYRLPAREQLELLFRVRARDLYRRVNVIDQPESMRLFRDNVQRAWLVPSCATTACHGGADAGRLVLASKRPGADPSLYTNFYILQNFKLADGTPLLDLTAPEKSAIIQMAMPREDVLHRHPPVIRGTGGGGEGHRDQWRPIFRSKEDRRIADTADWLKSLYRPRPDYGIQYTPPRPFETDKAADPGR